MQQDPYSPPKSSVHEDAAPAAPRPLGIWLLLLVLVVILVLMAIGTTRFLGLWAARYVEAQAYGDLALAIAWRLALAALVIAVLIGVFRRRNWARWAGVLLLGSLAAWSMLGPDTTVYANEAQRAGGSLGRTVIMPLLLAWWIRAIGFSPKAKRYFARHEASLK